MSKVNDLLNAAVRTIANMCFGVPALAIQGASSAAFKTTNAVAYTNDGKLKSLAATASISLVATGGPINGLGYSLPAGKTCYFAVGINDAGAVKTFQGTYDGLLLNGSNQGLTIPDVPAGYTMLGLIKVVNGTASPFVPGTTALDAASITTTYLDCAMIPSAGF